MGAVASGSLKKPGLSPDKAKEFLTSTPKASFKKLKEYVGKKK